ncbi:MAG: hypothetical protein AB2708_13890, partial [Candidatus Thiodiazotropha taylori]
SQSIISRNDIEEIRSDIRELKTSSSGPPNIKENPLRITEARVLIAVRWIILSGRVPLKTLRVIPSVMVVPINVKIVLAPITAIGTSVLTYTKIIKVLTGL